MYIILYNPLAKNRKSIRKVKQLEKHFTQLGITYSLKNLITISNFERYVDSIPSDSTLILVGGDGTIGHVANDLIKMNYKNKVIIYPSGSGNDFYSSLKGLDFSVLPPVKADTRVMSVKYDQEERFFINGCGVGIDGEIVAKASHSKYKNKLSYLVKTLQTLFSYQPSSAKVYLDDEEYIIDRLWICSIQNGKYFGGGMMIAPDADILDDYLDVCIVHKMSKIKLLFLFPSIYSGNHIKYKQAGVIYKRVKKVEVKMNEFKSGQIDGDFIEPIRNMSVNSNPEKLLFSIFTKRKTD
jgi:YegS/Rv2252/BmrU family lipid kinase